MPATALGYDSQGHGIFHSQAKRYDIKSKGFFVTSSKNFLFMGNLGFHFGANYSLENRDEDKDLTFFCGVDKNFGEIITFIWDYDIAWNDNDNWHDQSIDETLKGLGKGYMNICFDVNFTEYLKLKIAFYDLLKNRFDTIGSDRTLTLVYSMTF
jgi:hypothetical protein